jgi:hypothetical protein
VKATAGQIRQWKRELKTHPDDPETRARLLGATLLGSGSPTRTLKREHALWFIAHLPTTS